MPRPYIAVLVGGATHQRPFPVAIAQDLGTRVSRDGARRRRLGADHHLAADRVLRRKDALAATAPEPRALFRWGQAGDNPYLGYLALADAIVVTGDSVSMA